MDSLKYYLAVSVYRHKSLCPRQVLGVRIGLAGAEALGVTVPRDDKRLLVIVETDGCFVSGVEAVTGCAVSHRTLRVEDYGKVAATFVDVDSGRAMRVATRQDIRQHARDYAPEEKRRYYAMLKGYQAMPTQELLSVKEVVLTTPIETIVSRAGVRVNCDSCGEEIINEREVTHDDRVLCRACANPTYYQTVSSRDLLAELSLSDALVTIEKQLGSVDISL
ncbi:MAG: formylmethanofuran dehydrogenase [Anaerolineae bacterium]|jgi:formylmethanofuran dehydrogenase subunit E|nr:formylmethanofuran dehydrogenase [Anaerolineae bacterium]MBT7072444.1 formylmethanofuran dehydrogenase [Anaerolineae bacterium]MBT7989320.1 formylmethanofuran dehydrogenase [Anaerolineae bacterium]